MQNANGSNYANGQQNRMTPEFPEDSAAHQMQKASARPKKFRNGRIVTCVFPNPTAWGEIAWKIDQYRVKGNDTEGCRFRGCYLEDLQDSMRGLYDAKRWIKQVERRRRTRWFFWWW